MELEDLKQHWQLLNKRLEATEVLNQKLIQQMLVERTNTTFNKIYKTEMKGLLLAISLIPINCLIYAVAYSYTPVIWFITLNTFLLLTSIWQIIKVSLLKQFDIENQNIYELSKIIIQYKKWIQGETISAIPLAFILSSIWLYYYFNTLTPLLLSLIVIIIATGIIFGFFVSSYTSKNIRNIHKSLNDLEDFYKEKKKN